MTNKTITLAAVLACFNLPAFSQNININPQDGQQFTKYGMAVTLADSGSIGSNQTWDFSSIDFEDNNPQQFITRLPDADELTNYPLANIAIESINEGAINYYNASADSLVSLGNSDNGNLMIFSNPRIEMSYPIASGTVYHDTARFSYFSGATEVFVETFRKWQITGSGTLITPENTWNNVYKISAVDSMIFTANGSPVATVKAFAFNWYNETESTSLTSVTHDDYYNETKGIFLSSIGFASLQQQEAEAWKVFPNPATDHITIDGDFERYELVSPEGKTIRAGKEPNVSLSDLPEGVYLLRIFNGKAVGQRKIVKTD